MFQRGIHQLQQLHHARNQDENEHHKARAFPLMIQGLRTNPKDAEGHILCFDIEALIGSYTLFVWCLLIKVMSNSATLVFRIYL